MADGPRIGGLARFSGIDWPGRLVATVFCQGCPWACPYCHNAHLIPVQGEAEWAWAEVRAFLERRRGLLDGVVFSGGEPTLHPALPEAVRAVRAMGFEVGLHSGGPWPDRLAALLPDLDWVGFDVKAPFARYGEVTGVAGSGDKARDSLRRLIDSRVAFEVRTTLHPDLLDDAALDQLAAELLALGVRRLVLQPARPTAEAPVTAPFPALSADRAAAFESVETRA
ncbi:anaerobic ribonucleoside-triphosphate reductase activating protein [Roseospirillum parvum]|uniref:Pyruvate formate lyase activating enzyme n=1 Tax=Roseospirillum parvum TaxID=83401 RepID=A0A1G8AKJ5_9PROT|nr:anaerobic ribonucleoside-triphosphate reductase activating protein [Roseospirillum parvum]SDH21471.1 pyruvate formate lyase activating enzyme [Roseospirillum parvum]